jgi:hypothetical protein
MATFAVGDKGQPSVRRHAQAPATGYPPRVLSPAIFALLLLLDEQPTLPAPNPPFGPRRGALSAAAAVVPGVLIHGSGHFAGGDRRTAGRLLAAQGVGLGAMVAGLGALAATGASRRVVSPFILLIAAGAGLFSTSALADLYGVLAPPGGTGAAPAAPPALEAAGGALYVRNPVFDRRWLAATALEARSGRWRLSPRLFGSADGQTLRAELPASYRLWDSGRSFADLRGALVHHRDGDERAPFDITQAEMSLDGRSALDAFAPSLAGSFLEWGAGLAIGGIHYGGRVGALEPTDLLLGRFGFGFYLGPATAPRGEVLVAYDHRHDGFAGGLKIPGLGSGTAGHFGVTGSIYFGERWGVRALAEAGSAHVIGLSLVYRQPGTER